MYDNTKILIPVHTKVPGRARFRIKSPEISKGLRQWIDAEVRRLPSVKQVRINSVTCTILVLFDPEESWRTIAGRITEMLENLLAGDSKSWGHPYEPGPDKIEHLPALFQGDAEAIDNWHAIEVNRILEMVDTSMDHGLDPESVRRRIHAHGFNVIHEARVRGRKETLKDQLMFLPMAMLLAESVAALLGGALFEAVLLSAVTAVNVCAGYLVDRRSEEAITVFKRRSRPRALVLRRGEWIEAPGEELVVGDVVRLTPGTYVGADCRILQAYCLKIDESILTGESNPVDKHAKVIRGDSTPLFDRRNMAFMGTLVVGGEGVSVVVATGAMTQYGKLSFLYSETVPPQTPVVGKIHALSGSLLKVGLAMSFGVLVNNLLRGKGWLGSLGAAFSIAASAMPEGLPSAATVNMAVGFRRLRQNNVSIRRLYSLESLGAVQMICFDKTGTLTLSQINVREIYCSGRDIRVDEYRFQVDGKSFSPVNDPDLRRLFQACLLCAESRIQKDVKTGERRIAGSPTEKALLRLAMAVGLDPEAVYRRHALQKARHRDDSRRYMTTVHSAPAGRTIIFVKGDPTEVLEMCSWEFRNGRRRKLREEEKTAIEIQNERMAGEALRVLGFAYTSTKGPVDGDFPHRGLTWIGLTGMAEPVREGVVPLMSELSRAGIRTAMITGDQSATAEAVARRIRLDGKTHIRVFDSSRFDALTPELASALVKDIQVYARVNPAQKLQIIQACQGRGMVVAMTGDGINDGPAMRAADVGVAMGLSGTDAAREVADMVLEHDNITSIATTVLEGRAAYRNLKRALRYFISTHFSDLMLSTAAAAIPAGEALLSSRPIRANLLTGVAPGLGLLMEPARPGIGSEPPRERDDPLFTGRDMFNLFSESSVLAGGALASFGYGLIRYGPGARAATLAYESLSAAKVLHALTCRPWTSDISNDRHESANRYLNAALIAAFAAQAGAMLIPGLRRLLNIAPMNLPDLAVVGLSAMATRGINRKIRKQRLVELKKKGDGDEVS